MAVEAQFNQEEDDKDKENQPIGSPQASGPSSGGMGAPAPAHTTTPSGRPNIQQYLQANQGAGQRLAQGIENTSQKQAGQLGRDVNTAKSSFEAGANPLEQNLGEQGQQKIQTAFKDPNALLNQQNNLSEFQKLRDQGYNQDISNVGNQFNTQQQGLQSQANKLSQNAQLAGNEAGRYQLLRNTFGQPNYSSGQQRLDQLFLQAQPGANKNLQTSLQGIQNQANQQVSGLSQQAQAKLAALTGLSGQRATDVQNLLQKGTSEGLEGNVNERGLQDINTSSQQNLANAQAAVAQNPALRQRLESNQLTPEDVQKLGLQKGQSLYGLNLNTYMNQNELNPTLANTANPEEFARYRALQQLSGDTSGDIYSGATEAGGFNPYNFDASRFQQDQVAKQKYYEEEHPQELLNNLITRLGGKRPSAQQPTGAVESAINPTIPGQIFSNYGSGGMRAADPTAPMRHAMQTNITRLLNAPAGTNIADELNRILTTTGNKQFRQAMAANTGDADFYKNLQQLRGQTIGSPLEDEENFNVT